MKNTSVLGVPVSLIRRRELPEVIGEAISRGQRLTAVAVNARKIVRTVHCPEMRKLIMGFDIFLADGQSVVKAAGGMTERITGIDLMEDICRCSARIKARIFFYGAAEENNLAAQKTLKEKYPSMIIAGYCNGYKDGDVLEKIEKSGANVIFVAKGTPDQEKWIMQFGERTGASFLMGVGGAFDVFAGQVKRAPQFVQNIGMEWLYRMVCEPKRFRQVPELLEFRRLVKKEKKQEFQKINGGSVCRVKKLQ